jgi:hypothetical protein
MNSFQFISYIPARQDHLSHSLVLSAFIGLIAAFAFGTGEVLSASLDIIRAELWRMTGFFVSAGMFALLALEPWLSAAVPEPEFFRKLIMAVAASFFRGVRDADIARSIDILLVVMTAFAYFCTRGLRSRRIRNY